MLITEILNAVAFALHHSIPAITVEERPVPEESKDFIAIMFAPGAIPL